MNPSHTGSLEQFETKVVQTVLERARLQFPEFVFSHSFSDDHSWEIRGRTQSENPGKVFFRFYPKKLWLKVPLKASSMKRERIQCLLIAEELSAEMNLVRAMGLAGSYFPNFSLAQMKAIPGLNDQDPLVFLFRSLNDTLNQLISIPNLTTRIEGNGDLLSCFYKDVPFTLTYRCRPEGMAVDLFLSENLPENQEPSSGFVVPYDQLETIQSKLLAQLTSLKLIRIFKPGHKRELFYVEKIKRMLFYQCAQRPNVPAKSSCSEAIDLFLQNHLNLTPTELEQLHLTSKRIKKNNRVLFGNYVLSSKELDSFPEDTLVIRYNHDTHSLDFPSLASTYRRGKNCTILFFYKLSY